MTPITTFRAALAVIAAALVLQGCTTVGPGYDFTRNGIPPPQPSADPDKPPRDALTEISPDVIAQLQKQRVRPVTEDVRQLLVPQMEPYRLGAGDVVGIVVYDHPEIASTAVPATTVADPSSISPAPGFIISNTGQLSFPYAGTLKAEGLTVQELEDTLLKRLSRVFKEPQLNVRVTAFRSKRAYVEGEVKNPGIQVFTDIPMTLPEAINRAGGILTTGDRSAITLTRGDKTVPIDLVGLAESGVDPNQIMLKNGDLVMVRARDERRVSVMGEVLLPQSVLMYNGRMSLNDALSAAGGVNYGTANPRQIYVIRNRTDDTAPDIFHLDARTATSLALAERFPLQPKDVVYVDPVGLVMWSRIINLILPSTTTVNSIRDISARRN